VAAIDDGYGAVDGDVCMIAGDGCTDAGGVGRSGRWWKAGAGRLIDLGFALWTVFEAMSK
jgi:hypothetical protein